MNINQSKLATIWDTNLNGVPSSEVKVSSKMKFWWLCDKGHSYQSTPKDMFYNATGCGVCRGLQVLPGYNDLASYRPLLVTQWHPKNILNPTEVTRHSQKKVWWVCAEGHEWEASIGSRSKENGRGCPYCSGRFAIPGETDLATLYPHLMDEWSPANTVDPSTLKPNSVKNVHWVCGKGHQWEAKPNNRTANKSGCPYCSNKKIHVGQNDFLTTHPLLAEEWHPSKNALNPEDITYGHGVKVWWQCDNKHEWEATPKDRVRGNGCPSCYSSSFKSKAEDDIRQYVESLGFEVQTTVRSLIKGQELDIYVPEKNLAIEYNGLYWHTEAFGKDKWYHYKKWEACRNKGLQLLHIWEDDWKLREAITKTMLAHKLGRSQDGKVFARNTQVVELSVEESRKFLTENHIQGYVPGSVCLSLQEANIPVALMVLKKEPGSDGKTLNLLRYATSKSVVGGFTKLLSALQKLHPRVDTIITFSDNCVSDGKLYSAHGFLASKELEPDYMYVVRNERKHKFGYRLKRFETDPTLKHVEGLSEIELAKLNGIPRIWDAGKTRWVLSL